MEATQDVDPANGRKSNDRTHPSIVSSLRSCSGPWAATGAGEQKKQEADVANTGRQRRLRAIEGRTRDHDLPPYLPNQARDQTVATRGGERIQLSEKIYKTMGRNLIWRTAKMLHARQSRNDTQSKRAPQTIQVKISPVCDRRERNTT